MKLCLSMGVALTLFGCGGGEGSFEFHDPREAESGGRQSESRGDSRDSPAPRTNLPGTGGGGPSDGPPGQPLLSACSGAYTCSGVTASLSAGSGTCDVVIEATPLTLEPDGTVTFMGGQVGTWQGDSGMFDVCLGTDCLICTRL